jgi:hypothetical protein
VRSRCSRSLDLFAVPGNEANGVPVFSFEGAIANSLLRIFPGSTGAHPACPSVLTPGSA